MKNLINLLDEAQKFSSHFTGGYSERLFSAEEFHEALKTTIAKLKQGDPEVLNHLWLWFAPTCDCDDLIGKDGEDLPNKIHPLLNKLVKV
jgi:hypothetical protein